MGIVQRYSDNIKKECEIANEYAREVYVAIIMNQADRADKFRQMVADSLEHADMLLSMYSDDIARLEDKCPLSDKDKMIWACIGKEYVESISIAKKILE